MPTLSELLSRTIAPEAIDPHSPSVDTLSAPIVPRVKKADGLFEAKVFNFLLANKLPLGIKTVMMFTALRVDGAVELIDGSRLTVEVRYRMNWEQACIVEWEFRTFLKRTDVRPFPAKGGLVVFDEFSGDWARRPANRVLKNGWNRWYQGHAEVEGVRLDLLRLRAEKLIGFLDEKGGG